MDLKTNFSQYDYLIINDCSKDNTLEVCNKGSFNVADLPNNLGIGGAVQTGYKYAYENGYDIAIQFDGDGQHNAEYIPKLVDKIENDGCNMVIGSRFISKEGFQSSYVRRLGIKYFSFLLRMLTGVTIKDITSGFRACDRELIKIFAKNYPCDYPEPESTVYILRKKYKISEIPVIMNEREFGKSSIGFLKSIYYTFKVTLAMLLA